MRRSVCVYRDLIIEFDWYISNASNVQTIHTSSMVSNLLSVDINLVLLLGRVRVGLQRNVSLKEVD